jgi:hypothetical protein
MKNIGKQSAYKEYHKKVSEEMSATIKGELIQAIVTMLKEDEGNYQGTIYDLVWEALETRTIPELKTWLEN